MIDQSLAHPAHETTPGYVLRGLGIFELHRDEIIESYQGGGRYLVPSGTDAGNHYEVRVGTRPERHRCECKGFASHKHCSHITAAQRTARLSGVCDGCGQRVWRRDLVEVQEDNMTCFEGDTLCKPCADRQGACA